MTENQVDSTAPRENGENTNNNKKKNVVEVSAGHGLVSDDHPPISYLEALANLFKANVGTGCFGMADAIKNAGIILGPIATIVIAIICVECMHMLVTAAEFIMRRNQLSSRPDFAQVIELCFSTSRHENLRKYSKIVKKICNISICITQLGFCCVYIVFVADSFKTILDFYTIEHGYVIDLKLLMALALIPILLTALVRQLKTIAIFSIIANFCMITGAIITMGYCMIDLPPIQKHAYVKFDTLPLYFGTVLFAFEGIAVVLPLQNSMKRPENFSKVLGVLNVGMVLVSLIYILLGTMGYWKYGEKTNASLTLNLPTDQILAQIIILMVALGVLLGYAIQFFVAIQIMLPSITNTWKTAAKYPIRSELIFRAFMVLVTFTVAQLVPNLSLLLALIGSVCCVVLVFVYPVIAEMITKNDQEGGISVFVWVKNLIIMALAACGFVLGGGLSMINIYESFSHPHI